MCQYSNGLGVNLSLKTPSLCTGWEIPYTTNKKQNSHFRREVGELALSVTLVDGSTILCSGYAAKAARSLLNDTAWMSKLSGEDLLTGNTLCTPQ